MKSDIQDGLYFFESFSEIKFQPANLVGIFELYLTVVK